MKFAMQRKVWYVAAADDGDGITIYISGIS